MIKERKKERYLLLEWTRLLRPTSRDDTFSGRQQLISQPVRIHSKSHSSNDATAEAAKATAASSKQHAVKTDTQKLERASEFALVRMLSANIPTRNCNLSLMILLAQRRASQRRMWDCLLFMTYFFHSLYRVIVQSSLPYEAAALRDRIIIEKLPAQYKKINVKGKKEINKETALQKRCRREKKQEIKSSFFFFPDPFIFHTPFIWKPFLFLRCLLGLTFAMEYILRTYTTIRIRSDYGGHPDGIAGVYQAYTLQQ